LFANNVTQTQELMGYTGHWLHKQKDKNWLNAKQYSFDMHLFRHFHFIWIPCILLLIKEETTK
jgi:hypothetical protein